MRCLDANVAVDYVDGRLTGAQVDAIEGHVAGCDTCRRIVAALVRESGSREATTEPRERLGRFELIRLLGQGGMGRVYEAIDTRTNARVAVKTLRHMSPESLFRFKHEFRSLQDIQHPNLVSLGELFEHDGTWLFTMELVRGVDFLTHVRGDGSDTYDELRLRRALSQLALGVSALHEAGKVHRDIKPSNILVTETGRVVLLDFGLVSETDEARALSTAPRVVGTVAYMAPEQAAAKPVGPAADWYSVGVMMYQALTGALPFPGSSLEVLADKQRFEPAPPRALRPEVSEALDTLCVELLDFEPERRPDGRLVRRRLGRLQTDVGSFRAAAITDAQAIGRQRELAQLRDAFASVNSGTPVAVHVHGESGVGKSTLIRELVAEVRAEHPGALVLSGRCYEREEVPYKALDPIIDALSAYMRRLPRSDAAALVPRHAFLLPRLFAVLGRVDVIAEAPVPRRQIGDARELRTRAFSALRELLFLVAERTPLICVIDDMQWADPDSLGLIDELMRPPDAPALMFLFSSRLAPPPQSNVAVQTLAIETLPEADAVALAKRLLEEAGTQGISAEAIAHEAAGHPLYIAELVRHATAAGALTAGLRLDGVITERVRTLEPIARDVLELIALSGVPLPVEVVAAAVDIDAAERARHLNALRVAKLTQSGDGTVEPYHDRVRQAVIAQLTRQQRQALHVRLARALESSGVADERPDVLLRHLEAGEERQLAATAAHKGARRAESVLAHRRAAELYKVALRLTDKNDTDRIRSVRLDLARCLAVAGHGAEAAEVYLQAAHLADSRTRRQCQRDAAEQLLITGHIERGLQTLDDLLADVGVTRPRSPRRALGSLIYGRVRLAARGLRWTAHGEAEAAAEDLARLDVYQLASDGLAMVDNVRGADFQTRSLLLALRVGEPKRICQALGMEACFAASQGKPERARALIDKSRALADTIGDPALLAFMQAAHGGMCYLAGNFERAQAILVGAERALLEQPERRTLVLNNVRLFRLFSLRHLGEIREWQSAVDDYTHDAVRRGDLYAETSMRRTNNMIWLVRDDPEEARRELGRTTWTPPDSGYHLQHLYSLLAQVDLAAYRADAELLLDRVRHSWVGLRGSLLLRIQLVRALSYFIWGRAHLLDGGPRTRRQVRVSIARLRKDKVAYAQVYAQLLDACLAEASGSTRDAAAIFSQAAELAGQHRMRLIEAAARRRSGECRGGSEGEALITSADEWMASQGVKDPERLAAIYAPRRT